MSKSKKVESDVKKDKKILLVAIAIIIVLAILLVISRIFGDYSNIKLKVNDNAIFSISDLVVDDLEYSDTEKEVIKKLGKPKKTEKFKNDIYDYKKLHYNGLILTLRENYDDFMLVKAEITSGKYETSRGLKVSDKITDVYKAYKVENKYGTYIYGNYSADALKEVEITKNIYFGVRSKKNVVYINRDSVIENTRTNIARLDISYKNGKVSKITWSYDFE